MYVAVDAPVAALPVAPVPEATMKRTAFPGKVVPSRTCEVCLEPYTPHYQEQRTCGNRCGGRLAGRTPEARRARDIGRRTRWQRDRAARKRQVEARCHHRWPELSVREIEIFNFAKTLGYDIGYQVGLKHQRRRAKEQSHGAGSDAIEVGTARAGHDDRANARGGDEGAHRSA